MNNLDIKTISEEKVKYFIKDLKIGDCCKIVSRKCKNSSETSVILDLFQNQWLVPKENSIVLILDKATARLPKKCTEPSGIAVRGVPKIFPIPTPESKNWYAGLWYSWFIKTLYKDQICLIHAGWLEKI